MDFNGLTLPLLLGGAPNGAPERGGIPVAAGAVFAPSLEWQRAYIEGGADVLCAPMGEHCRHLGELTRQAADGRPVAGCIGSAPALPLPRREADFEALAEAYRMQTEALLPYADLFLLQNMEDMPSARAAMLAVRAVSDRPVWVRFVCDEDGRTPSGTDILAALITMQGMGASAFGLRCDGPMEPLLEQFARLASYAEVPLMADVGDRLEVWVQPLAEAGVRIFCGESPAVLHAVRCALAEQGFSTLPTSFRDPDVIACASEQEGRFITPTVDVGETIHCSLALVEDILRAEESPQGALKIAILGQDDLDLFVEHQYVVQDALCLWSDVPELLERALRLYQGRAFWDGTGDLPEEFLLELQRKYGLVLL